MRQAGEELIQPARGQRDRYLEAARGQIPKASRAQRNNEAPVPQVDFGLIRDERGNIVPRLVEIQAFPSLYAFQPVLEECYRDAYDLEPRGDQPRMSPFRQAVLGNHAPENVILLEIDPLHQKTLPDFLLTERVCGIQTVDIRDVRKQGRKLYPRRYPD